MTENPPHPISPPKAGDASGSPPWVARVRALYSALDAEIAPFAGLCRRRGVCCDFRTEGHRLYATEVEVQYALQGRPADWAAQGPLCPFWEDGLCHAREVRPLGCRTYFCDPRWRDRGEELYARFHRELQRIGDSAKIPYRYRGWVARLREVASSRKDK